MHKLQVVPLAGALRFPGPEDPAAGAVLEGAELDLDEQPDGGLVAVVPEGDVALRRALAKRLAPAGVLGREGVVVGAVVAGADAEPVEPFGTVGDRAGELADK